MSSLDSSISFYPHRGSTAGVDITVRDFLDGVATGRWRQPIEALRAHSYKSEPYEQAKNRLECAIIGGTFEGEKVKGNLRDPSGFMAVDFDDLGDEVDAVKAQLKLDKYVFAVFRSAGGNGLCALVRVEPSRWDDAWQGVKSHFLQEYGRLVDKGTGNINRLRYVTYDPDIHVNEKALLFREYPRKKKPQPKPGPFIHTGRDIDHVLEQIHARALDLTSDYDAWYRIGFALISEYGEGARDYFHQVSRYHADYNEQACEKTFRYLVSYGSKEIRIATFYWYAKQAGLDVMTPRTKEIVSVAAMGKKQKITPASAVDQLGKMNGIPPQEAAPVVEQVYQTQEEIKTDETPQQQLKLFLTNNFSITRNVISRYLENEGKPMYPEELNDVWLAVNDVFGKEMQKQLVLDLLFSNFIPKMNPVQQFFAHYSYRRPVGVIKALAESIETDTGLGDTEFFPDYAEVMIRKWLVGLVSAVYDEHCPLILVMTGKKGTGKTEWFRRLLPAELRDYFAETHWPDDKDTEMKLCQNLITFNDEWKGLTVKDPETLKSFASRDVFTLREPYGSAMVRRRRLALMCGTSNPLQIIADPGNNRKIIPLNVLSVDYDAYNAIDKIDVLMEAYHAYQAGERHYISLHESERIDAVTGIFGKHTFERNLLEMLVKMPTDEGGEFIEYVTPMQLTLWLETKANNRKLDKGKIEHELQQMGFKRTQKRVVRGENPKWVYALVKTEQ